MIVLLFLSFFDVDNPDSNSKCLPGSISLFLRQHVQYVSIMHRLQVILVASGPKLVASGPRLSLPHGASVQVCTWLCAWLAVTLCINLEFCTGLYMAMCMACSHLCINIECRSGILTLSSHSQAWPNQHSTTI